MALGAAIDAYLADAATYKKKITVDHFDRPALNLLQEFADEKNVLRLGDLRGDDMIGRRAVLKRRGTDIIRAWKIWLMAPDEDGDTRYNAHTTDMWMRCGSTFLNYYGIHPNPFDQVERPATEAVGTLLTDAQVRRVPEILPWRVARAVLFAFMSGLRRSGILSLDYRQVRPLAHPKPEAAAEVTVTEKSRAGRPPQTRTLDIPAVAIAYISPLKDNGPVFGDLTPNIITHYTKVLAKALKLGRFRFHDCRHNWGTRAARRLTLDDWMRQGGWRSLSSAHAYLHLFRGRREEGPLDYGLSPSIPPIKRALKNSKYSPSITLEDSVNA